MKNNVPALDPPYGQRTDAFRRLLFEFRFQPLHTFAELQVNPSESLLIVLGDPRCLSKGNFPKGLRAFVEQGGAALIATDMKTEGEAGAMLSQLAGVTVTGETLVCKPFWIPSGSTMEMSSWMDSVYDNSEFCPYVCPLEDSAALKRSTNVLSTLATLLGAGDRPDLFRNPHPDQRGLLRVATNAPSRLKVSGWWLPSGIHRLARLPDTCQDEKINPNGPVRTRLVDKPGPLFAVGGAVGAGRVLVLADHSIFINRMILPRDTGNLEFAANCLHWLRGGASTPLEVVKAANSPQGPGQLTGQRNKALFWDDGQIHKTFDVPMKTVPLNPSLGSEPAIVAAIDQTLARMEDNNAFNQNLLDELDDMPWTTKKMARDAVYALTLAFLLALVYGFIWRGRYRLDAAVPRLARLVAQHEPKASLLEQRRRAVLRAGNVWETAHQLARQCFASAGIPLTGDAAPRVSVEGGWWRRWRISRRVARLWELARGATPARVPPAALKRWLRELEELNTALENGKVRLM